MTEAEKKMKKYVNGVERRLNLPREIKARVMSDFGSSISARREAGQTDDEIMAELGTPRQAAAELNEQMKEFTYRKNPWRFAFLAAAVYGGYQLLSGLMVNLLVLWMNYQACAQANLESVSVGIIGGADGPTAIFVTTPVYFRYIFPLLLLVVGLVGYFRLRKCSQK